MPARFLAYSVAIQDGDPQAAERLLPLVYEELRRLAAQRVALEKPGQTLQATALVHEAYLRLVGGDAPTALGRSRSFFCRRRRGDAADSDRSSAAEEKRKGRRPDCGVWTSTTTFWSAPSDEQDPDAALGA